MTPSPRYLSDEDVREYLAGVDLQPALENAVRQVEAGSIVCAPRAALGHGPLGQVTHLMAAKDLNREQVVTKLVDYDPSRPRRTGRPSLSGLLTFMVAGEVLFLANAAGFTNIRTAASTAMAIELMNPSRANVVAIFGAGPLAKEHALAIARRRPLSEVRIVSLGGVTADRLADDLSTLVGVSVRSVKSPREACTGAGIVVTVTSAVEPILHHGDVEVGTLVAAVGSGTPNRRELDGRLIASATEIVVETLEAAESEAGDLISAHDEGYLDWTKVRSLADILRQPIRTQPRGIAIYKSVGASWQDLACASAIAERLKETKEPRLT